MLPLLLLLATPPVLGLIGLVILLTMPAPPNAHHCIACRYPRTGLPPRSPCPECGHPFDRAAAPGLSGIASLRAGETLLLGILSPLSAIMIGAYPIVGVLASGSEPILILFILPLAAGPGFFLSAVIIRARRDWLAARTEHNT